MIERMHAGDFARRMAEQAGIDLNSVKGSGPNGRIVKADIEAAQKSGAKPAAARRFVAGLAGEPWTPASSPQPAPW